jgi:hypothetical protein
MFAPNHPRAKSQRAKRDVKQGWERLYRAAIIEPARSKLLQRIEVAEAAIVERSRRLSKSAANSGKEQKAITRALRILSFLPRETDEDNHGPSPQTRYRLPIRVPKSPEIPASKCFPGNPRKMTFP